MKFSAIVKNSIYVLSLIGAGNILIAPASAQQAAARSAFTVTNPSGYTESVSAEVLLPKGLYFMGVPPVAPVPASSVPGPDLTRLTDSGNNVISETLAGGVSFPQPPQSLVTGTLVSSNTNNVTGVTTNIFETTINTPAIPGTSGSTFTVLPSSTEVNGVRAINNLSLNAGEIASVSSVTGFSSITSAVVTKLDATTNIEDATAIIKAAVGAGGLE